MAEDRISSIIDLASIQKEVNKVKELTGELATILKTMPKAKIELQEATNYKEVHNGKKQTLDALAQLKIKNSELTVAIKEQILVDKQAASQRKADAAQRKADAAARKEEDKQAQIAGQERLRQLAVEKKAQEEIVAAEAKRADAEQQALSGTYTAGSSAPKKTVEQFIPTTTNDRLALALVEDQRQLTATKDAQKLLNAEFKAGNISQAEYDAQLVKSIQVQNDLKVSIANTTKELSLQAKSNASIPGTIEALQTRNAVLNQQANQVNVVNASPEEVAHLKVLNDEIDKNNELIRVNKDLLAQQKINIGNYPQALGQTFKTLNTELDQVQGKLRNGNFGGKEFDQLTAKQAVLQNALSLTGKTYKSSAAEATAYKEAALQIGQVYGKDSSIFKQFAEGVKTGAVNTKALANEVSGVVSKEKGFSKFFNTAYGGLRKLANLLPNFGISTAILLLLVPLQSLAAAIFKTNEKVSGLGNGFKDLRQRIKDTESDIEKSSQQFEDAAKNVNELKINIGLAKDGFLDKDKVVKQYNATLGRTTGEVKTLDEAEQALIKNGDAYIKMMLYKAAANIALGEAAKKAFEAEQLRRKKESEFLTTGNEITSAIALSGDPTIDREKLNLEKEKKNKAEQIKLAEDSKQEQLNIALDFQKKATEITKGFNFDFFGGTEDEKTKKVKKSREDSERLLQESLKKDLEEIAKANKSKTEALLAGYKADYENEENSLTKRLDALRDFYKEQQKLIADEQAVSEAEAKRKEDQDLSKADSIKNVALREKTIAQIKKTYADTVANARQTAITATHKLAQELSDKTAAIISGNYKKETDELKKNYEQFVKIQEQKKKFIEEQISIDANNKVIAVQAEYEPKIKSASGEERVRLEKELQAKITAIDKEAELTRSENTELSLETQMAAMKLLGADTTSIEKLITDEKRKQAEIRKGINDDEYQHWQDTNDKKRERIDKIEKYETAANDFILSINSSIVEKEKNDIQDQIDLNDIKSQKELDAIAASTLSEEEKARRTMTVQKAADFQKTQLEQKQRQLDIQRAEFEKAAAITQIIIQTILQVIKAGGLFTPKGIEIAAFGAIGLAEAIAQPIPHFKKGTQNAPKGPALVSEEGPELLVDRYGKMFLTPAQPSLIALAGGEKIFSHNVTKDLLIHHDLLSILQKAQVQKQPAKVENNFNEKIYRELRSLNGKPPVIINVAPGIESKAWYRKHFKE